MSDYIVLDLETQNVGLEVGGWWNVAALQVSVACTWDEDSGYRVWWEGQMGDLLDELDRADMIVGYNVIGFDFEVLSLYGRTQQLERKTFDVMSKIAEQTGRLRSLDTVSKLNLGEGKLIAEGLSAVQLWREQKLDALAEYCQKDVELTTRLYEMWQDEGLLWVSDSDFVIWPGV
jgi:DEAD/DEAH box helicase domain-containing protein